MMLLTMAMELGALLVKPKVGTEYFTDGSGCARGMALEAVGQRQRVLPSMNWYRFAALWPWTINTFVRLPCWHAQADTHTVSDAIAHLFDDHVMGPYEDDRWTYGQLVDWVRMYEPPEHKLLPAAPIEAVEAYEEALCCAQKSY